MHSVQNFNDICGLMEASEAAAASAIRRVLHDAGFRPVPVRNAITGDPKSGKAPAGMGWQNEARRPFPDCLEWDTADADAVNTGLLADGLRVIDIDLDDEGTAEAAQEIAETVLGRSPAIRRRDGTGRRALLYRAATGEPEKKARGNTSTGEKVEVLGRGQHLVAYGSHHSGQPIRWLGLPGLEVSRDDLPAVTEEQIDQYLGAIAELIAADPPKVYEPQFTAAPRGYLADDQHDPLTEEDIRAALSLIADGGYDRWRDVGAAIHDWDSGMTGLSLFDDWSRAGRYDTRNAVVEQWNRFRGMRAIHVGSLLYWARETDPEFVPPSRRAPVLEMPAHIRDRIAEQVRTSNERHAAYVARQQTQPKGRRFRMLTNQQAASLPRPRFLIPGLIIEKTIGCVYGPSGSLKSFLMLDLALSLAHGLPWCGHPLEATPVVYVAAEGAHGLGVRIAAWERDRGVEGKPALFRLVADGVNLMDAGCMADLTQEIAEEAKAIGKPVGLVVFDTLATCAVGMEENSGKETGIALGQMSAMRHTLGACVFAVHHTGKDAERGMRGSYRLKGDFDTVIEVDRMEKALHVSTFVEKQKDGPDGQAMHFTAHPVEWVRDDEEAGSLVIRPRAEHLGANPAEYQRIADARLGIAGVLELNTPMSRFAICKAAGWNRGRNYATIDQAVTEGGCLVDHPAHGRVRLSRNEEDQIIMTKE